jgi:nicotinamide-nucleotide amidase
VTAHILTIGDELLIGQVVNTNQAYIGEKLNAIGVEISAMTTVGDDMQAILDAFAGAWGADDVVIVTGGLGPTHDDITRKAFCSFFDTDLVRDASVRAHVEALLAKRNIPWNPAAEEQTMVPRAATVFPNPLGTAPGLRISRDGKHMFVLPGVPYEMEEMVDRSVVPFLAPLVGGAVIRHRTIRTTGISESFLARELGDLDQLLRGQSLAFLPSPTGVRLRITVRSSGADEADRLTREIEAGIRAKAGEYIYGTDEEELEEVVGTMLLSQGKTIGIAESCTGGLLAHRITNVSGSSGYFGRGVVAYSNATKTELLGVPPELLAAHGAVSKPVAIAMAEGIRTTAPADIGLSTTGIAGPTGGTPEKPVGLVWIGYADATGSLAVKFTFGEGRLRVKERATQAALEIVRRRLSRSASQQ